MPRLPHHTGLSRMRHVAASAFAGASLSLPKCPACPATVACHVYIQPLAIAASATCASLTATPATPQWPFMYAARCPFGLRKPLPEAPEIPRLPCHSGLSRMRLFAVSASASASLSLLKCHACPATVACMQPVEVSASACAALKLPKCHACHAHSPCRLFPWVVRKPRRRRRGAQEYTAPCGTALMKTKAQPQADWETLISRLGSGRTLGT